MSDQTPEARLALAYHFLAVDPFVTDSRDRVNKQYLRQKPRITVKRKKWR